MKNQKAWRFTPFSYASSKFIVETSSNNNGAILAMVTGGRVINENPNSIRFNHGVDTDIAGAYGTVMEMLTLPIAIAHFIKYTPFLWPTKKINVGGIFKKT